MSLQAQLAKAGTAGTVFQVTRQAYLAAKAQSADVGPARFKRDFAYSTVQLIGNLIVESNGLREKIRQSDSYGLRAEGLTAWDSDFEGLETRYTQQYKRWFELNPLAWDDPASWSEADLLEYEQQIEKPIYVWSLEECKQNWVGRAASPCEGPDLLTALSLLHQITVAEEFERQITSSIWLFDLTMEEFVQFYVDVAKAAAKAIIKSVGAAVANALKPDPPGSKSWWHYLLGAITLGGLGYGAYRLLRKDKEESNGAINPFSTSQSKRQTSTLA